MIPKSGFSEKIMLKLKIDASGHAYLHS